MTEEGLAAMEELFSRRLAALATGRLLMPPAPEEGGAEPTIDWEAADLILTIRLHLAEGALTPTMVRLLDDFLGTLDERQRWAILGIGEARRRKSATGQCDNAALAFAGALREGRNEEEALAVAYDAYFAAAPKEPGRGRPTYAADLLKEVPTESARLRARDKGRSVAFSSLAAKRMATVIRPCLRASGLLGLKRAGRRPRK